MSSLEEITIADPENDFLYDVTEGKTLASAVVPRSCSGHVVRSIKELYDQQEKKLKEIDMKVGNSREEIENLVHDFEELEISRIKSEFASYIHAIEQKCEETIEELKKKTASYLEKKMEDLTTLIEEYEEKKPDNLGMNKVDFIEESLSGDFSKTMTKWKRVLNECEERSLLKKSYFINHRLRNAPQSTLLFDIPKTLPEDRTRGSPTADQIRSNLICWSHVRIEGWWVRVLINLLFSLSSQHIQATDLDGEDPFRLVSEAYNPANECLKFYFCPLDGVCLASMSTTLGRTKIRWIDLSDFSYYSERPQRWILSYLGSNTFLERLDMSSQFGNAEDAIMIADLLKINTHLKHLAIRSCKINDSGAKKIAEALRDVNRSLQVLDLRKNEISDKGARDFAECISTNETLEMIDLTENLIGEEGIRTIRYLDEHGAILFDEEQDHSRITEFGFLRPGCITTDEM